MNYVVNVYEYSSKCFISNIFKMLKFGYHNTKCSSLLNQQVSIIKVKVRIKV